MDGEAPGSGEPRRTVRRRTQARAKRRESARRTHHGRCCHRRLNDGRRWSRNGRRLIGSRGGRPRARARAPAPAARFPSVPRLQISRRAARPGSVDVPCLTALRLDLAARPPGSDAVQIQGGQVTAAAFSWMARRFVDAAVRAVPVKQSISVGRSHRSM